MNTIQVFERNVYGRPTIYPTGEHAKTIVSLTGKKTLGPHTLGLLRELGHKIEIVPDPESAVARFALERLAR